MKAKRFISLVMALCLAVSLGVTASAQETSAPTINLMVDGKLVKFYDGQVTTNSGRTIVPYRDLIAALGGTFSTDNATKVVTVTFNDVVVSFSADSDVYTVKKGDKTTEIKSDMKPTYIGDVLYVPVRSFTKALGLNVSWDGINRTVVIVNTKKLGAELDKKYNVLNKLMVLTLDPEKVYKTTGTVKQTTTVNTDGKDDTMIGIGTADALSKNADMVMTMEYKFDFGAIATDSSMTDADRAMLSAMENMKLKMIYNSQEETIYVNLDKLGTLMGDLADMKIKDTDWFKLDFSEYADMCPEPEKIHKLLQGDISWLTMGNIIDMILNQPNIYNTDSYELISFCLDVVEPLMSDKAFKNTGTATNPKYTYTLTDEIVVKALADAGTKHPTFKALTSSLDISSMLDFNYDMAINVTGKYSYEVKATLNYKFDLSALGVGVITSKMLMDFKIPGSGTMSEDTDMDMDGVKGNSSMDGSFEIKESKDTLQLTPPTGAKIIDLNEMIGAVLSSLN